MALEGNAPTLEEVVKTLSALTCSTESIQGAAAAVSSYLHSAPSEHFNLVCLWLKSLETHPNKVALLYLANELLQTARVEQVSRSFEQMLPDAFRLMGSGKAVIVEMRRVLIVWRHRGVFLPEFIDLLSKICDGLEAANAVATGNTSQLIRLALQIDRLEQLKHAKSTVSDSSQLQLQEQSAREDYILELAKTIKHLNVQLTTHCIYLQQLNTKCEELKDHA